MPYNKDAPNKNNPDPNAPKIKYFNDASTALALSRLNAIKIYNAKDSDFCKIVYDQTNCDQTVR